MKSLITTVAVLTLPLSTLASFCGESSIPFSFEALPNGVPVLGCARPSCFGLNPDGTAAGSTSSFYRVSRRPDGFFRKVAESPRTIDAYDAVNFKPQIAKCAETFDSEQCSSVTSWVGGFGPASNVSSHPLAVQCCEYEPLKLSENRGVAVVHEGQIVIGGEILSGERQYAFDYISDVVKHDESDGKVSYYVSMRRLPCLPYPPEFSVNVENFVEEEMFRIFGKKDSTSKLHENQVSLFASNKNASVVSYTSGKARAHHARIQNFVDSSVEAPKLTQVDPNVQGPFNAEPVQSIEGPFIAENEAVVETANALPPGETAIQGVELPPNQVPNIINTGGVNTGGGGSSYYYPINTGYCGFSSAYVGGGSGCGFFCFSADTKVNVQGGIIKRMDELQLDDWVLSGNEHGVVYSRVENWLHRMPDLLAEFIHITMEDGSDLKLTNKHYIYRGDCSEVGKPVSMARVNADMVYADEVTRDNCLFVRKDGIEFTETRISKIDVVKERGIYAPMTHSGNIVVNNIYASCLNVFNNNQMQLTFSEYLYNFANSFWAKLWVDEASTDVREYELIPGMHTLVDLLTHIVPNK